MFHSPFKKGEFMWYVNEPKDEIDNEGYYYRDEIIDILTETISKLEETNEILKRKNRKEEEDNEVIAFMPIRKKDLILNEDLDEFF